ncbi:MAG: tRNA (adenosine(37)-N6)-threonylcarbamoyltransferase complex ATPase subunit type 1 TsaE [Gammaproteobacteria bacterium]|nr:tRNA (adenosine(37)-N6)-threonylcarbamoyltransferase complex ATPase subunit type 1 TsaE [Gammaproteobacteria bacterium]
MLAWSLNINTPEEMESLGHKLYHAANAKGMVSYLSGDLGAGKTTFVRGFLRAMAFTGNVKSPTYTLVEPYEFNDEKVYHFDFYRLNSPEELEYMGIRDYFQTDAYCLVEWPEKAQNALPEPDLQIQIEIHDNHRLVTIKAQTDRGKDVLQQLKVE